MKQFKDIVAESGAGLWGTDALRKKLQKDTPGQVIKGIINTEDPCWDSHKQVGTKKKGGKTVPNCVPKNEGAEVYIVKKGTYTRKVDGATADRMKKDGWRIAGRETVSEGSESWEDGYDRRVVKTTKPEHKEQGYNWRIKGKDKANLTIKLYKNKPSQEEFNKQMKRVAGHEFGG